MFANKTGENDINTFNPVIQFLNPINMSYLNNNLILIARFLSLTNSLIKNEMNILVLFPICKVKCTLVQALRLCKGPKAHRGEKRCNSTLS